MDYSKNALLAFNFYYDIKFWLFFFIAAIIFRLALSNRKAKIFGLCIFNILFLLALPRFTLLSFIFLLIISMLIYSIGILLNNGIWPRTGSRRKLMATASVTCLILILSFFKYDYLQEFFFTNIARKEISASDIIFIIGISYISFKMIHFVIECYKQQIDKLNLLLFFNFIFFFPSFISGPITRYSQFAEQAIMLSNNYIGSDLKNGIERIIHGLFKKFVLSTIIYPYAIVNSAIPISNMNPIGILIGLYAYTLYFYFDFAGYSDLAIGASQILGIKLPENFNNPFMKSNIQQLWANWHMSLTTWLTDYVYWPLTRKLRSNIYFKRHPITLSNISIIVTFIICGMWHGDTFNFVLWGLYQGVGIAILNIYRAQKRRIRNGYIRRYFKSRLSEAIGIIGTFNFFALGILFFAIEGDEIALLLSRIINSIFA